MTSTVELQIPTSAQDRIKAREFSAPLSDGWLDNLQAHIDEGGLIGEAAAHALLSQVYHLMGVVKAVQPVLDGVEKLGTTLETAKHVLQR